MSAESVRQQEIKELDELADRVDFIACTNEDTKLRALLFAAEKNLRAAGDYLTSLLP